MVPSNAFAADFIGIFAGFLGVASLFIPPGYSGGNSGGKRRNTSPTLVLQGGIAPIARPTSARRVVLAGRSSRSPRPLGEIQRPGLAARPACWDGADDHPRIGQ
jgi:hypothetical protein